MTKKPVYVEPCAKCGNGAHVLYSHGGKRAVVYCECQDQVDVPYELTDYAIAVWNADQRVMKAKP